MSVTYCFPVPVFYFWRKRTISAVSLRYLSLLLFVALIVPAAGRLSTTNFYWQSCVSVSLSVTC